MLITVALSLPLGILAAKSKGRWADHISRLLAYIDVSTPSFWLAFLMISYSRSAWVAAHIWGWGLQARNYARILGRIDVNLHQHEIDPETCWNRCIHVMFFTARLRGVKEGYILKGTCL
jgi:hypothetical protein